MKTVLTTHDGTCIITDPEVGTVSARNQQEAAAEIRRRKGLQGRPDGAGLIITKHHEIQTGREA